MLNKKEKLLFLLDLDGTILEDSVSMKISEITKQAIKRTIAEGHIVCIVTGRPWRSTKKIYNELKLTTVISNHNAGHIHRPFDDEFLSIIKEMELNELMYILGNKKLKESMVNFAIQGINWVQIKTNDPVLDTIFGFTTIQKFSIGIDIFRLPIKPLGAIIDLKPGTDIIELGNFLKRRYGDLAEFSSWPKDEKSFVFEITPIGSQKNNAVSFLTRYYDVHNKNTIAIGDGWNDISMFEVAEISVAMKNAKKYIKDKAMFVTKYKNTEGGVGHFINNFLDNTKEFRKVVKKKYNDNKEKDSFSYYH